MLWPSWINRAKSVCRCGGSDNSHSFMKPCLPSQLQTNSPPLKNCHLYCRGQVDFKNAIPMSHGKHKQICFLRSMGSTFSIFVTPPQPNDHFFWGIITAEGCQKWQIVIPMLHEKPTKNMLLTEHGKQIFDFCNPSRLILLFLAGFARFWPVLAGSGRLASRFVTFLSRFHPNYSRRGSRLREFTSQTPSNYYYIQ